MPPTRTPEQIRGELDAERQQLAGAVEQLRGELGQAANISGKLKSKLPFVAAGAANRVHRSRARHYRRCRQSPGCQV